MTVTINIQMIVIYNDTLLHGRDNKQILVSILLLFVGISWIWWWWWWWMASVHNLLAHLLGEGELHSGAGGGSQLGDALLHGGNSFLDLWDSDTFLSI